MNTPSPYCTKEADQYHQDCDGLIGRKSDHLTQSIIYTRGAVRRYEPRYNPRMPILLVLGRVLLALAFFGLVAFVVWYGLMELTM